MFHKFHTFVKKKSMNSIDRNHIWHPYASATRPLEQFEVISAQGVYLELANGAKIIDGMSSWWSVIHGYNHPRLNAAMHAQIEKFSHVMFGGLTHAPAIKLTETLLRIVPQNLQHVFYSDSGSVAVEVAMKMALQYQVAAKKPQKRHFATIRGGYHGDTWNAMSVCDPVTGMHSLFSNSLTCQFFVSRPQSTFHGAWQESDLNEVRELFKSKHKSIAAFIIEPIVQGAGGMYFYHPQFLRGIADLCKKYNILLIADEIATGFGRSGTLFACEHAAVQPDIMCIGKALTGGYMSFAATLCSSKIAHTISENPPYVFMHGPTFMANPLACALACESINLLLETSWQANVLRIERELQHLLQALETHAAVAQVRVLGAIGVVEMHEAVDMSRIQPLFVAHGVWLRPFGKLIYTMPPYCISSEELQTVILGMIRSIEEYCV
ncbi:MAG: adenosylmethionine--8-amino-7-oxononanoate transaminase [Bacteroidales bacterium]|jgi:adenosylmethionine-8-amino-7-oxononanoate aminotransferase|nr:adenosylmethionine--8-amino-7-oxononanoate transaminase [Bacteroidales bacterium]